MLSQKELPSPLPQELLDNIFRHVDDIGTVLSLRLTCKTFYAIATSLWLYFAREIYSKPENPRSEEPLEDYTSEELRHWVLRRHRAEQVWEAISKPHVRTLEFLSFHPVVLPGGRWILFRDSWGQIMVMDMDRSQLEPKLLVSVVFNTGDNYQNLPGPLTVWVDPHAPRLSFRIAWAYDEDPTLSMITSHIFQARLLGHGDNATITAQPFRQFEGVLPGKAKLRVLNGRYFIQIKNTPRDWPAGDFAMYVFDCEKEVSTRVRLCGFDSPLLFGIFIPSDDEVAIIGVQSIYIFSIPTSSQTPGSQWYPIHTISVARAPQFTQLSEPYIGKTSTTIMYLSRKEIMALEVPHNIHEKGTLTHILEFPAPFRQWRTVGLFDAINYQPQVGSGKCFLTSLRYPWDPSSGEGPKNDRVYIREIEVPSDPLNPPGDRQGFRLSTHSFHKDIGRLVVVSKGLLCVYDLTPVGALEPIDDGTM